VMKEITIVRKFSLMCAILPYYGNLFSQWEMLMTKLR